MAQGRVNSAHLFYVYILYRPWDSRPCYVGKGRGDRVNDHFRRRNSSDCNKHLASIFRKAGSPLPFEIIFSSNNEAEVFAEEIKLISAIGRADLNQGPLCNWTNGGEGKTKAYCPDEVRAKHSAVHQSRSQEQKAAINAKRIASLKALWASRSPECRTEIKKKQSAAHARHTPEQKADINARTSRTNRSTKQARTEEQRAITREKYAATIATRTPEQRAEVSARVSAARKAVLKDSREAA